MKQVMLLLPSDRVNISHHYGQELDAFYTTFATSLASPTFLSDTMMIKQAIYHQFCRESRIDSSDLTEPSE